LVVELMWNYRSASRADAGKVGMIEGEVDGKVFGCRYRGTDDHATRRGPCCTKGKHLGIHVRSKLQHYV